MKNPLTIISKILLERDEWVSVAESVTSGHIQAAFSRANNALRFFPGGITTYTIDQKIEKLKVTRKHAERVNCVSGKVAKEMAIGVSRLFSSQWSVAITGYAAPVPEKKISHLFAWVAVSYKHKIVMSKRIPIKKMTPLRAQKEFKQKALQLFAFVLAGY